MADVEIDQLEELEEPGERQRVGQLEDLDEQDERPLDQFDWLDLKQLFHPVVSRPWSVSPWPR